MYLYLLFIYLYIYKTIYLYLWTIYVSIFYIARWTCSLYQITFYLHIYLYLTLSKYIYIYQSMYNPCMYLIYLLYSQIAAQPLYYIFIYILTLSINLWTIYVSTFYLLSIHVAVQPLPKKLLFKYLFISNTFYPYLSILPRSLYLYLYLSMIRLSILLRVAVPCGT